MTHFCQDRVWDVPLLLANVFSFHNMSWSNHVLPLCGLHSNIQKHLKIAHIEVSDKLLLTISMRILIVSIKARCLDLSPLFLPLKDTNFINFSTFSYPLIFHHMKLHLNIWNNCGFHSLAILWWTAKNVWTNYFPIRFILQMSCHLNK